MRRVRYLFAAILFAGTLALPVAQGCSSQQTTETTTAVTNSSPANTPLNSNSSSSTTTTTTTTVSPEESHGILGDTFHLIGTAIAYPFHLLGDVLGAIF